MMNKSGIGFMLFSVSVPVVMTALLYKPNFVRSPGKPSFFQRQLFTPKDGLGGCSVTRLGLNSPKNELSLSIMVSQLPGTYYSGIVVDDDEIDRLTVIAFLEHYPFVRVTGKFSSAEQALAAVADKKPDILFLDVDMPGMTGLQLREKLKDVPVCIFITSFPEYAVEGFEKEALDFLVKPITASRFAKTMERIQTWLVLHQKASLLSHTLGSDVVFIREGHHDIKIQLHEIQYLEAMKDYTAVITRKRKYMVATPMGSLIKEKPFEQFIRIHRSYTVPRHFIKSISSDEIELEGLIRLPVGRTYKTALASLKL
jgi:two-component system, LytTR family, response regulator